MSTLRFGTNSQVTFDTDQTIRLAKVVASTEAPLANIQSAVQQALREPLDFPPLDRIVLSDDTVVIPLQPGLPCVAELIAGTVASVIDAGVPPELIRILRAAHDSVSQRELLRALDPAVAKRLTVTEHDPTDREQLSYLGASKQDHAIYINREICDAGLVLPIGVHGVSSEIYSSWFPTFSDLETQGRFRKAMSGGSSKAIARQLEECEEVGWMTGIQFVIELIPGGNDEAMEVLAGLPSAVWKRAGERFQSSWDFAVDEPVELVLAGISGGPAQQTWDNVAQTVERLLDAVEVDGAIAICTHLKTKPGPALRRLASAEDFDGKQKAIQRTASVDAQAASRLNRALQRVRIYLLSELREVDIENLGLAFVSDVKEITKLSSQFSRCLAFENAQYVSLSRTAR